MSSYFNVQRENVLKCIHQHLGLDARNVEVAYVDDFEFYKLIKSNHKIDSVHYKNLEDVKERYRLICNATLGFNKWKERRVVIKINQKFNFGLLLVELLHAKSITQRKTFIKPWIREGLTHFIARVLCFKCDIEHEENTLYRLYFPLWERIYDEVGLNKLRQVLFVENIQESIKTLKQVFNYTDDDILEIPYGKAISLMRSLFL